MEALAVFPFLGPRVNLGLSRPGSLECGCTTTAKGLGGTGHSSQKTIVSAVIN